MRKEIVEKIFLKFDELSEHGQFKEIKKARKDTELFGFFFDFEMQGYELNLDELKKEYNIDFDVKFVSGTSDIESIDFKESNLYKITNYKRFIDDLERIIHAYRFLFELNMYDEFDEWVRDYFIDSDIEFLMLEKVVESE